MTEKWIPSSSQTVGPYFRIGLDFLTDRMAEVDTGAEGAIEIRGRVLDREGSPVSDAMLEFWSPSNMKNGWAGAREHGIPAGFRRTATDENGHFVTWIERPIAGRLEDGRIMAPHLLVLIFARGLLRHLISRIYLEDETGNEIDPVLLGVPAERRTTLVAKCDGANVYRWNVILQGTDETVFFAW